MSVILITGSSSGIGLATALHFGREGHEVYASLRNPDSASELAQVITNEKLPITPIKLDINDEASVKHGVEEVIRKAGHIDVLVNNAGVGGTGPVEAVSIENAKKIFETNYFGAIRTVQAVLPAMRERRSGTIVMVTSIAGRLTTAGHGQYSASKHALEAISEILAQELRAFNIRVAIIEPGVILTPIFAKGREAAQSRPPNPVADHYVDHMRRLMTFFQTQLQNPTMPEEVADMIAHAVTTDQPRLRYVVGEDARALLAGYQQTTDEERVEIGRLMTDDEYYDIMYERFGVDLFRP
jgi:NAD(P)-dependent dehydrogenase (short-subunit alcohol dehydrogenase family)